MKLLSYIYYYILRLRYRIYIKGYKELDPKKKYLVLPNHEALVDPQIVTTIIGKKLKLSPIISETYYNLPIIKYIFKIMGAVPMGDLQRGTGDLDEVKKTYSTIIDGVNRGKNILLYPAGQLYAQGFEVIRGKKTAFQVVSEIDSDVEIILVRVSGLWGSMWSRAWMGDTPGFFKTYFKSIWIVLANLVFFIPKRKVGIEVRNVSREIREFSDMDSFNKYLEGFYNELGEEDITYKRHYFYYDNTKNRKAPESIVGSLDESSHITEIKDSDVPSDIRDAILQKIQEIKDIDTRYLTQNTLLINDLYFDSLDLAEIKSYIQIKFKDSSNPPITSLKSIGDLSMMAMGRSTEIEQLKPCDWSYNGDIVDIYSIVSKNYQKLGDKASISSMFKEVFKKDKSTSFVYDNIFGLQSRGNFLVKSYLLSKYFKKYPEKHIGIMLPSIASSSMVLMGLYLAGKTPVMLNWTLGESSLNHTIKYANISNILTSKTFYEQIKNDSLDDIQDKYIFLEDLLSDISIITKIGALISSKLFMIPDINSNDEAVILFTSGSESMPKAVSLTHKNIIRDIVGALYHFPIDSSDILLGYLPPFHSFGFSVNTIMPLISGLRVAYTPDPNDAMSILNILKHTKTTSITTTPTFLKMILNISNNSDLQDIKYVVSGAEKMPLNVAKEFEKLSPNGKIMEGYGITECSPVISINPPSNPKLGSVGRAIYGSIIKIISLDDQRELSGDKEGMIYFKGDNVFNGYLDSDIKSPFEDIDGDRYYKTGDLGYLDSDGYLYITGRLKRFVKIAGEMISLPFIEEILNTKYSSDDTEIALEALEEDGEVTMVVFTNTKISLDDMQSSLRSSGVSNLVKISRVEILDSLPVLGTGKIDYKILKNMI